MLLHVGIVLCAVRCGCFVSGPELRTPMVAAPDRLAYRPLSCLAGYNVQPWAASQSHPLCNYLLHRAMMHPLITANIAGKSWKAQFRATSRFRSELNFIKIEYLVSC